MVGAQNLQQIYKQILIIFANPQTGKLAELPAIVREIIHVALLLQILLWLLEVTLKTGIVAQEVR